MKDKLMTLNAFDRAKAWLDAALQAVQGTIPDVPAGMVLRIYRSVEGTAGKTTSPYKSTKWDVTDSTISEYVDGMVVNFKVPVDGVNTYGGVFQINNLGYKPVVYGANTSVGGRYPVGGIIWMQYNATQTASWYDNSASATSVTGCWQVMDYDANTTAIYTLMYYRGTRICSADLYRYVMCVFPDDTHILPLNSTVGTSPAGSTSTSKVMTTGSFDPMRGIVYYSTNAAVTSGSTVAMSTLYRQTGSVDLRYTFNCGSSSFTANSEVYMVMDLQSDGRMCKLASTPFSNTLPSTNDGHLYMLLGYSYSKYQIELYPIHTIYYHDGTNLKVWTGATAVSGTNDGTNWTSITIGNTTKAIPACGSSLPSQTGNSGKILKTDGTDASWDTLNSAIPVLTSPVRIWDLEQGIYFLSASCVLYYNGSSSTDSITLPPSLLIVTNVVASVSKKWDCFPNIFSDEIPIRYRGITMENSGQIYTDYSSEFIHTNSSAAINTSTTTITFDTGKRCSQIIYINNDLGITFAVNNKFDNYLWISNFGSAEVDITVNAVTKNGYSVSSSNIHIPADGISVPAGGICEIGIIVNTTGAFITSRNDLK